MGANEMKIGAANQLSAAGMEIEKKCNYRMDSCEIAEGNTYDFQ